MIKNIGKGIIFITVIVVLGGSYVKADTFPNTKAGWEAAADQVRAGLEKLNR